jgi:oligosaccharide repeat unit polymerase
MKPSYQRNRLLYFAVAIFAVALGAAVVAPVMQDPALSNAYLPFAFLSAACLAPAVVALVRRRFDLFEPIYAFALSTMVYFVFVPAVQLSQNSFTLLGVDYSANINQVTVLAFLALVGFSMGYYWRNSKRFASAPSQEGASAHNTEQRRYLWRWAALLFVGFLGLITLWVVIARIPLATLWIFGEASYGDAWNAAVGPQIGYLYGAREALPACLLLLIAYRSKKRWSVATVLFLILVALFFAGSGARFRVLVLVLSVVIFYYLERSKRPKLWQSLLVAFVVFYFVIGGVGFYRSYAVDADRLRGRSIGQDTLTLNDAWDVMLDSSQIAASTALLVRVVPSHQPYFLGTSFLNFFTQPIPRFLWADKPTAIGQEFFDSLWPPGTTLPFWAIFYLNFGPVAIVPGMIVAGWVSRKIYDAWRFHPDDVLAQVQLAIYWPFLIHMYGRGGDNFAFNVYGLVFVMAPVWIMMFIRRRRQKSAARAEQSLQSLGAQGQTTVFQSTTPH